MEITIALAGNPNAGKTSIFNGLTGSHQHVGNWPGVTVERKEGEFIHGNIKIKVVDLPGTYSLTPYTIDERIARDFIVKEKPELVVVIADASNLERNLYLLIEIMQLTKKTLLVLNMVDIAEKKGIKINHQSLSKILGIPVVKTIANKGVGIKELKDKIVEAIKNPQENVGEGSFLFNERIELAVSEIRDRVSKLRLIFPPRFIALKLLEKDDEIRELVFSKADNGLRTVVDAWIARLEKELGDDMASILAAEKYAFIHGLYNEVVELKSSVERQIDITDRVDRVLTNRYLGIPLFLFIMWIIFQLVFKVGNPLADIIDKLMGSLAALISEVLSKWGASSYAISFITDGIIGGVGSVLVFIPNIMLLFLAIAILEDSGYMARAAFVMDKLMHSLGLHGKSAIPMIVSFGCNIPGILATRTLKSEKDRILTILILPLMSCSARLPIYVLFASVFFSKHAAWVIFSLYLLGIILAILMATIFKKTLFRGETSPLIMELPPYRIPYLKSVWLSTWQRTSMFLKKAGTFILATVVLVWIFSSLPLGVEYASPESIIGRIGVVFAPILKPAGFGFWQAAVSLIFGFLAKEVVIGTMGTVWGASEESLRNILPHYFSQVSALSFMVFSLIYVPCVAAVATIWKEAGSKWALISIAYSMLLAYLVSVLVFNIGNLIF